MADAWRQGFWRNDAGALLVAAGAGTKWQHGWRLNADDTLAITPVAAGAVYYQGLMRNADGALYVKPLPGDAPVWRDGFLRDTDGALMTSTGAGAPYHGFLRSPEGALITA